MTTSNKDKQVHYQKWCLAILTNFLGQRLQSVLFQVQHSQTLEFSYCWRKFLHTHTRATITRIHLTSNRSGFCQNTLFIHLKGYRHRHLKSEDCIQYTQWKTMDIDARGMSSRHGQIQAVMCWLAAFYFLLSLTDALLLKGGSSLPKEATDMLSIPTWLERTNISWFNTHLMWWGPLLYLAILFLWPAQRRQLTS